MVVLRRDTGDLVFVSSWREGDVLTCMEHQAARDYKQDLSVVESSLRSGFLLGLY